MMGLLLMEIAYLMLYNVDSALIQISDNALLLSILSDIC